MNDAEPRKEPHWNDRTVRSKTRVGLWLKKEVGEGGVFTTGQLHEAFPDIAHVDRRVRELREEGWVIETSRTDRSLRMSEMRFVAQGRPIWSVPPTLAITQAGAARSAVLQRDRFTCRRCGLSAGPGPTDAPLQVLEIARRTPLARGGSDDLENLITLCANCHRLLEFGEEEPPDADALWREMDELPEKQRSVLLAWMALGQRPLSRVEHLWATYERLPPRDRREVMRRLAQTMSEQTPPG